MNELLERTERLLAEPWLEGDVAAIEATAARVHARQRRVVAVGALALVVVVGIGAALATWPDAASDPATVDAAGAPEPVYERADSQRMVFLEPTATAQQQADLRSQLIADPAVGQAWWRTPQDAYDEFVCTFVDDPEMIESVTPSILPASIDVVLVDRADLEAFDARMRADVSVTEVIVRQSPDEAAASGTSMVWRPADDPGCGGSPRVGEPIK